MCMDGVCVPMHCIFVGINPPYPPHVENLNLRVSWEQVDLPNRRKLMLKPIKRDIIMPTG